jgi:hypothetical protein
MNVRQYADDNAGGLLAAPRVCFAVAGLRAAR